ncbi:MAG: hypothetical protein RLZZ618_2999 [Pseudomonadota bacterium]|jgi:spermidine synthase
MPTTEAPSGAASDSASDPEWDGAESAEWERAPLTAEPVAPFVHEGLSSRTLYFSISAIQSRMDLKRPDALDLEYTRTMMGALLLVPQPRSIAMIGLGGGSLAKFCHRHLPRAQITVVEINHQVIALREFFKVPADSARFAVLRDDGAAFVANTPQRFDLLLVDAFDAEGMPDALGTPRFYDDCFDVLLPGGVLVVNLHAGHALCEVYVERIRASFGGEVVAVSEDDGCNRVVFACKGVLPARGPAVRCPLTLDVVAWGQVQSAFSRLSHALAVRA